MASKDKNNSAPHKSKLDAEVEASFDTQDPNLGMYIEEVIKDFKSLGPLEKISLMTPEDANKALEILNETQARLDKQMKAASALRRLLNDRAS